MKLAKLLQAVRRAVQRRHHQAGIDPHAGLTGGKVGQHQCLAVEGVRGVDGLLVAAFPQLLELGQLVEVRHPALADALLM